MTDEPVAVFRHYKNGRLYVLLEIPVNPNTGQEVAVYCEYPEEVGSDLYWRDYDEFNEKFTVEKPPPGV